MDHVRRTDQSTQTFIMDTNDTTRRGMPKDLKELDQNKFEGYKPSTKIDFWMNLQLRWAQGGYGGHDQGTGH
jgi:hypothetical protein